MNIFQNHLGKTRCSQPTLFSSSSSLLRLMAGRDGWRETDVPKLCEIPKRRWFETLIRSVIQNTHVTWLRLSEASKQVECSAESKWFDLCGGTNFRIVRCLCGAVCVWVHKYLFAFSLTTLKNTNTMAMINVWFDRCSVDLSYLVRFSYRSAKL